MQKQDQEERLVKDTSLSRFGSEGISADLEGHSSCPDPEDTDMVLALDS